IRFPSRLYRGLSVGSQIVEQIWTTIIAGDAEMSAEPATYRNLIRVTTKRWLSSGASRVSSDRALVRQHSRTCRDRFFNQLPSSLRQWAQAASRQIPQAFIVTAGVKKNHAFACIRVVKSRARIFLDQLKECLPPWSIG